MQFIAFSSAVGPVPIDAILSEAHTSALSITEIPIEDGARVTDHALLLPKRISLDCASSNAAMTYNALVALQESRVPFTIVTGLFVYTNMLIETLTADRDKDFSSVLRCRAELKEIIIVSTSYAVDTSGDGAKKEANKTTTGDPLSANSTSDTATADRVSGTTARGDTGAQPVPSSNTGSILSRVAG